MQLPVQARATCIDINTKGGFHNAQKSINAPKSQQVQCQAQRRHLQPLPQPAAGSTANNTQHTDLPPKGPSSISMTIMSEHGCIRAFSFSSRWCFRNRMPSNCSLFRSTGSKRAHYAVSSLNLTLIHKRHMRRMQLLESPYRSSSTCRLGAIVCTPSLLL